MQIPACLPQLECIDPGIDPKLPFCTVIYYTGTGGHGGVLAGKCTQRTRSKLQPLYPPSDSNPRTPSKLPFCLFGRRGQRSYMKPVLAGRV